MRKIQFSIVVILLGLLLLSCSQEENLYTKHEDIQQLADDADATPLLPPGLKCNPHKDNLPSRKVLESIGNYPHGISFEDAYDLLGDPQRIDVIMERCYTSQAVGKYICFIYDTMEGIPFGITYQAYSNGSYGVRTVYDDLQSEEYRMRTNT